MLYLRKSRRGFTLIELMVVVAIIGVLSLLGLRLYTTQQDRAKNAVVKGNAGTVQTIIQSELADDPSLTLPAAITLGNGANMQNPYDPAVAVAVDAAGTLNDGQVSIALSGGVFTVKGLGKNVEVVIELTARR